MDHILLINGTRLEGFPKGKEPTNKLYPTSARHLRDVTTKAGLRRTGWASGVSIGDYHNDGNEDFFITYGTKLSTATAATADSRTRQSKAVCGAGGLGFGQHVRRLRPRRRSDLFVANYLQFDFRVCAGAGQGATAFARSARQLWAEGLPPRRICSTAITAKAHSQMFLKIRLAKIGGRYSITAVTIDFNDDGWTVNYVAATQRRAHSTVTTKTARLLMSRSNWQRLQRSGETAGRNGRHCRRLQRRLATHIFKTHSPTTFPRL